MPRKGRDLEKLVETLENILGSKNISVTSPDFLTGHNSKAKREVDISLRSNNTLVMIECRDRKNIDDVTWIEQLVTKQQDVKADKVVAVSSSGFSAGAKNTAQRFDIELRTMNQINLENVSHWFQAKELTQYIRRATLRNIEVDFKMPKNNFDKEKHNELSIIFNNLDINTLFFERVSDNSQVDIAGIWDILNKEEIYNNIAVKQEKVLRNIRVRFGSNFQLRFLTSDGYLDIDNILFNAELWIEVEKYPVSSVKNYQNSNNILSQNIGFQVEFLGKPKTIGLHKVQKSGELYLSIN